MLIIFLLSSFLSPIPQTLTAAAPVTPNSPPEPVSTDIQFCACAPDANTRSLWDIIWSCLAVIFACTWVAVHPNIPALEETWREGAWRRARLLFWAVVAPEMIIFWAMRQWVGARRIERLYRESHGWTKTHGFFVQMGGFLLYDGRKPVQTLTAEEMKDLSLQGLIDWPCIEEEEITDRSKGDLLGKGVAVFQTSWFVVQCIVRGAQGLVITELELITLAYAMLNGVIYFFWWNKPLDVRYPVQVVLRSSNPRMEFQSTDNTGGDTERVGDPEEGDIVNELDDGRRMMEIQLEENRQSEKEKTDPEKTAVQGVTPAEYQQLKPRWLAQCTLWVKLFLCKTKDHVRHFFSGLRAEIESKGLLTGLWTYIIFRPLTMGIVARTYYDMVGASKRSTTIGRGDCAVSEFYAVLPTFPELFFFNTAGTVISVSFGAIHCIAWAFQFPTRAEEIAWRIASLLTVSVPFLFIVTIFAPQRPMDQEILTARERVQAFVADALYLMYSYGKILYIFARLALLAVAIASLRALESGAYLSVDWVNFIPHI